VNLRHWSPAAFCAFGQKVQLVCAFSHERRLPRM
jgi:hypothetical protein